MAVVGDDRPGAASDRPPIAMRRAPSPFAHADDRVDRRRGVRFAWIVATAPG